ncbi:purine-nucleoside phosphorylase [Aspergillus stella-maris]|uniref:purine-nucleoside phosphorylase n=1 Tax=Aspergillus stella-maris TaxID=1810926 RepID=UPI003CCD96E7
MQLKSFFAGALLAAISLPSGTGASMDVYQAQPKISPKVFIVSMFAPEAEIWHGIPEFNLLAHNISLPGLSPLFPDIYCTNTHEICQIVTGEGEINAATTVSSLLFSGRFNLTSTYFLLAGIAGINPEIGPTASVTFARFAIQVALQYEFDAREIPANMSTGYLPQGSTTTAAGQYPSSIYGTEVFEVNDKLRSIAADFARNATLADSEAAKKYRALYASKSGIYDAATKEPTVIECDVATSDVYYSGRLLSEAFSNTTDVLTNGKGTYCTSAQEDNATLEALLRAAIWDLVDFERIIVMRTASDFERPHLGESPMENLFTSDEQGAFDPAVENLYRAGIKVVQGILGDWKTFGKGVKAHNYVGDILGSLGTEPDFGADVKNVKRALSTSQRRSRR